MRRLTVLIIGLMLLFAPAAEAQKSDIQVEKLDENSYRLTLKSFSSADVAAGQQELMPEARRVCGNKSVRLGRYEFRKLEPVRPDAQRTQLLLRQDVHCGDVANAPAAAPAAPAGEWRPSAEQVQQVVAQTNGYFAAKDSGDYRGAYDYWATNLPSGNWQSLEQWQPTAEKFNAQAGRVRNRTVTKVTWYNKPPQASASGIYAAVDFSGEFEKVGIYCGYLIWHLSPDGRFRLIREEQNFVDNAMRAQLKPDELVAARAKIRC
jgi:hypothetical protein